MELSIIRRPQWSRICQDCITHSRKIHFASRRYQQAVVSPESPRFIEVPEPPQVPTQPPRPVKGILPVPKNLFNNRSSLDKASAQYLDAVTPEPQPGRLAPSGPDAERLDYKRRMADMRRRNLRSGLTELQNRHDRVVDQTRRQTKQILLKRNERLIAPEPEDERLMAQSVSKDVLSLLDEKRSQTYPGRTPAQLRTARRNVARRDAAKSAERRDNLHTLYTHARHFIVNEDQLNANLEETFGTDENPVVWDFKNGSGTDPSMLSIWNLGKPEDVGMLLNKKSRAARAGSDVESIELERLRKIAGVLTGGTIPRS